MTPDEWRKRMSNCTDQADLEYLLKNKPKGAKSIIHGTQIARYAAGGDLPFLNDLISGKRVSKVGDEIKPVIVSNTGE